MKIILLFAILSIFTALSSCKKEDEIVDPRNIFLGTWSGSQTIVIPSLGISDSFDYSLTISLSTTNNKGIMINSDGETHNASVKANVYTYDKHNYIYYDAYANQMTMEIQGSGTQSGNKINESGTVKLYYMGAVFPGTWSSTSLVKL